MQIDPQSQELVKDEGVTVSWYLLGLLLSGASGCIVGIVLTLLYIKLFR